MSPLTAAQTWKRRQNEGRVATYVDLVRSCHALGVEIEYSDEIALICGLTREVHDSDGERTVVTIDRSAPRRRRLFTLAHEIGHIEFARHALVHPDEERWCDRFAAELVLTKPRPQENIGPASLRTLLDYAHRHDMGYAATLVTLRDHQKWRAGLLVITEVDGVWILINTYGIPHTVADHLKVNPNRAIAGQAGATPRRKTINLLLGTRPLQLVAECCVVADQLMVLVTAELTECLARETKKRREKAKTDPNTLGAVPR